MVEYFCVIFGIINERLEHFRLFINKQNEKKGRNPKKKHFSNNEYAELIMAENVWVLSLEIICHKKYFDFIIDFKWDLFPDWLLKLKKKKINNKQNNFHPIETILFRLTNVQCNFENPKKKQNNVWN